MKRIARNGLHTENTYGEHSRHTDFHLFVENHENLFKITPGDAFGQTERIINTFEIIRFERSIQHVQRQYQHRSGIHDQHHPEQTIENSRNNIAGGMSMNFVFRRLFHIFHSVAGPNFSSACFKSNVKGATMIVSIMPPAAYFG